MLRIATILAILAALALAAPSASAAPESQRHGHHGAPVGIITPGGATWGFAHHGFGFRHPIVAPGFGLAPFLPVVALPPPIIPVAVPISVPVAVPQPVAVPFVPPQVAAPALPASPCGCPSSP